jgi:hypothetical protein
MNIDTDTFAAIGAETEMLRKHAARHAAAREKRRGRPKHASRPGPVTQWHEAGREAAWREVLEVMTAAFDQPAATAGSVMDALMAAASGFCELREADTFPREWSSL